MRLLFDEDFNQRIVRGLLRRIPSLDARSAHDDDLAGATDDEILAVAAAENRLLVSATGSPRPASSYRSQRVKLDVQ